MGQGATLRQKSACGIPAVLLTLTAACSTVPNNAGDAAATAVPFAPVAPRPGYGAAYIGRPMTMNTSVFAVPIEVDGKPLVSLGPDQYVRVELPPGSHRIATADTLWSRSINGRPHPAEVNVESGKTYYLEPTQWSEGGHFTIIYVNGMAIPEQAAVLQSTFSVQVGTPPADFVKLTRVEPPH
jgi:hypothetical protein